MPRTPVCQLVGDCAVLLSAGTGRGDGAESLLLRQLIVGALRTNTNTLPSFRCVGSFDSHVALSTQHALSLALTLSLCKQEWKSLKKKNKNNKKQKATAHLI